MGGKWVVDSNKHEFNTKISDENKEQFNRGYTVEMEQFNRNDSTGVCIRNKILSVIVHTAYSSQLSDISCNHHLQTLKALVTPNITYIE